MVGRVVLRSALAWLVVAVVLRGTVLLPEQCPEVGADELRASAAEAVGWFERNQRQDGTWLYRYDAAADTDLGDYNLTRHAGVTMSLYQAHAAGHDGALAVGDAGARHALDRLLPVAGGRAFGPTRGPVPVGATGLLVAGLSERRAATGDTAFDDELRAMGRFLVAMTRPSGAVVAYWDPARDAPTSDDPSPFFTGEVYWALALLHRELPGEGWDRAAERIGRYLATERDDAEGWFPDISDHWAAYGLSTQAAWAGSDLSDHREYAVRQSGIAGFQVRWESQRTDRWPSTLVRGHRSLGAGLGTLGEQLAGLWRLAEAGVLPELRAPLAERTRCVAAMLVERQVSTAEAAATADPDRTRGAWFRAGITQMDDQQHAMSAVLLAEPIVSSFPVRVDEPWDAGAPRLLLLVSLALALDPLRAARSVTGARRDRSRAVSAGAALSLAGFAVAAAAGGPLLDVLDVSAPTLRLGAALVLVVTAVADLVRGDRRPVDVPEGRWAGLVPVAVPMMLRPASLVVALSAGADLGIWPVAAVAAVVGAAVAAQAWSTGPAMPGGDDGRAASPVRDWAARLLSAALLVVAVALAVDGVYDV